MLETCGSRRRNIGELPFQSRCIHAMQLASFACSLEATRREMHGHHTDRWYPIEVYGLRVLRIDSEDDRCRLARRFFSDLRPEGLRHFPVEDSRVFDGRVMPIGYIVGNLTHVKT